MHKDELDVDLYAILGVDAQCSQGTSGQACHLPCVEAQELRSAYLKLSRDLHPRGGARSESFTRVQEAYEVLSDEAKRRVYDAHGLHAVELLNKPEVAAAADPDLIGMTVATQTRKPEFLEKAVARTLRRQAQLERMSVDPQDTDAEVGFEITPEGEINASGLELKNEAHIPLLETKDGRASRVSLTVGASVAAACDTVSHETDQPVVDGEKLAHEFGMTMEQLQDTPPDRMQTLIQQRLQLEGQAFLDRVTVDVPDERAWTLSDHGVTLGTRVLVDEQGKYVYEGSVTLGEPAKAEGNLNITLDPQTSVSLSQSASIEVDDPREAAIAVQRMQEDPSTALQALMHFLKMESSVGLSHTLPSDTHVDGRISVAPLNPILGSSLNLSAVHEVSPQQGVMLQTRVAATQSVLSVRHLRHWAGVHTAAAKQKVSLREVTPHDDADQVLHTSVGVDVITNGFMHAFESTADSLGLQHSGMPPMLGAGLHLGVKCAPMGPANVFSVNTAVMPRHSTVRLAWQRPNWSLSLPVRVPHAFSLIKFFRGQATAAELLADSILSTEEPVATPMDWRSLCTRVLTPLLLPGAFFATCKYWLLPRLLRKRRERREETLNDATREKLRMRDRALQEQQEMLRAAERRQKKVRDNARLPERVEILQAYYCATELLSALVYNKENAHLPLVQRREFHGDPSMPQVLDVTVPLQLSLRESDGALVMPACRRAEAVGFYDVTLEGSAASLLVRYRHVASGEVLEAQFGDFDAVHLPRRDRHRLLPLP